MRYSVVRVLEIKKFKNCCFEELYYSPRERKVEEINEWGGDQMGEELGDTLLLLSVPVWRIHYVVTLMMGCILRILVSSFIKV